MVYQFAQSGIANFGAGDVEFVASGIIDDRPQYSLAAFGEGIIQGRRWIPEIEIESGGERVVHEKVTKMIIPLPGEEGYADPNTFPSSYFKIIRASAWINAKNGWDFGMPIPHQGSGFVDTRLNGTWHLYQATTGFGGALKLRASEDAYDFTNGDYECYCLIEFINI